MVGWLKRGLTRGPSPCDFQRDRGLGARGVSVAGSIAAPGRRGRKGKRHMLPSRQLELCRRGQVRTPSLGMYAVGRKERDKYPSAKIHECLIVCANNSTRLKLPNKTLDGTHIRGWTEIWLHLGLDRAQGIVNGPHRQELEGGWAVLSEVECCREPVGNLDAQYKLRHRQPKQGKSFSARSPGCSSNRRLISDSHFSTASKLEPRSVSISFKSLDRHDIARWCFSLPPQVL